MHYNLELEHDRKHLSSLPSPKAGNYLSTKCSFVLPLGGIPQTKPKKKNFELSLLTSSAGQHTDHHPSNCGIRPHHLQYSFNNRRAVFFFSCLSFVSFLTYFFLTLPLINFLFFHLAGIPLQHRIDTPLYLQTLSMTQSRLSNQFVCRECCFRCLLTHSMLASRGPSSSLKLIGFFVSRFHYQTRIGLSSCTTLGLSPTHQSDRHQTISASTNTQTL